MRRPDAVTLLRRMRDGRDPATDEPLPADHPFQRADVVRALFVAVEALEGPRGAGDVAGEPAPPPPPRRPRPPNAGRPWTEEDDRRLVEAFDGGADERELAEAFGRSRISVRSRLIRLGRGALLGEGPAPRYPVLAEPDEAVTTCRLSGRKSARTTGPV